MRALNVIDEMVGLQGNKLFFDYSKPREKGSLPTALRTSDTEGRFAVTPDGVRWRGEPTPHIRFRSIPGTTRILDQIVAYAKSGASTDILRALKSDESDETKHFVKRTAIYLTRFIRENYSIDCVVPIPSSKPIAHTFASEMALRLGVPLLHGVLTKISEKASGMAVSQRMASLKFQAEFVPGLGKQVLLADDFITTSSTVTAAARALYELKDHQGNLRVELAIATALTIH